MFANYNYDNFHCKSRFKWNYISNEDFNNFTQKWLELYNNKQNLNLFLMQNIAD